MQRVCTACARLGSLPQWCTSSTAAPVIWVRRCTLAIIPDHGGLLFSSAIPAMDADSVIDHDELGIVLPAPSVPVR